MLRRRCKIGREMGFVMKFGGVLFLVTVQKSNALSCPCLVLGAVDGLNLV